MANELLTKPRASAPSSYRVLWGSTLPSKPCCTRLPSTFCWPRVPTIWTMLTDLPLEPAAIILAMRLDAGTLAWAILSASARAELSSPFTLASKFRAGVPASPAPSFHSPLRCISSMISDTSLRLPSSFSPIAAVASGATIRSPIPTVNPVCVNHSHTLLCVASNRSTVAFIPSSLYTLCTSPVLMAW